MTEYRLTAAERGEKHGVSWWILFFDDGADGEIVLSPDPPPAPFSLSDRRRRYSEAEMDVLRSSWSPRRTDRDRA
jgi:hypothetical protein